VYPCPPPDKLDNKLSYQNWRSVIELGHADGLTIFIHDRRGKQTTGIMRAPDQGRAAYVPRPV
jgi:hypothetical protein